MSWCFHACVFFEGQKLSALEADPLVTPHLAPETWGATAQKVCEVNPGTSLVEANLA